jgi:transposase
MTIITVGIDLAKNVFSLHGVDGRGRVVLRRTVRRDQLCDAVAKLPACVVAMEACSGAHHWARQFMTFGHTVRLIAPHLVTPYRMSGKRGKNDAADAAAICEAATRPNMRFVPVKSVDQQATLCVHRVRQGFIEERTATINRLRGLLSEFGVVLAQQANCVRRLAAAALEDLPGWANRAIGDLLSHLHLLDQRIDEYDAHIKATVQADERAQRLLSVPGIGPVTASALVAAVGSAKDFKNGRQLAAWLGLVPSQHSTGGKARLGSITKAGDSYLRTLLTLGARSLLANAKHKPDRTSRWAIALQQRAGYGKTLVAIAAKNARIVWAMLNKGEAFRLAA